MSKSNSKDNSWLGGIVVAIVIIIIVAVYITVFLIPIVLLIGSIVYFTRAKGLKENISGEISDYWLSNKEKKEYRSSKKRYQKSEKLIQDAEKQGRKENLSINKDGSFSKRSKLGKEINALLDKQTPNARTNRNRVSTLEKLPEERWRKDLERLTSYESKSKGYLFSLASWIILIVLFGINSNWNFQMSAEFTFTIIFIPIIVYFIGKYASIGNIQKSLSTTPPKVNDKNIDEYKASHSFKYLSVSRD